MFNHVVPNVSVCKAVATKTVVSLFHPLYLWGTSPFGRLQSGTASANYTYLVAPFL